MSNLRVLSFDTSMSSPGACVIELRKGKPTVIAVSHVKTTSSQPHGLRAEIVESWATLFIAEHIGRGFNIVCREDFNGRTSTQNYPVLAAWSGCERAAEKFGLTFDKYVNPKTKKKSLGIGQSRVKLLVCGNGSADKTDVADAVRRLTGYKGDFATDDESDAAAVALAWLIENKIIEGVK
jgi:crossover junction endodeoxyribonuclease RuvC